MNTPIEIKLPLTEAEIARTLAKRKSLADLCFKAITVLFISEWAYVVYNTPTHNFFYYVFLIIALTIQIGMIYVCINALFGISNYEPIRKEDCGELLELCKKFPEIEDYRQQVVSMNRQFINKEYNQLRRLALDLKLQNKSNIELEQCKELYKV